MNDRAFKAQSKLKEMEGALQEKKQKVAKDMEDAESEYQKAVNKAKEVFNKSMAKAEAAKKQCTSRLWLAKHFRMGPYW